MQRGNNRTPENEKRLCKKTFNSVGAAFFREIGKIFPNDPKLMFLAEELKRFSTMKDKDHVPAMQFFKAMNVATGLRSVHAPEVAVVGELVLNHDDRLFSAECTAVIPQLDAVDFKTKWGKLSQANRQFVWGYLDRMAQLSAKVAAFIAIGQGDVQDMLAAVGDLAKRNPHTFDGDDEHKIMAAVLDDAKVAAITKNIRDKVDKK